MQTQTIIPFSGNRSRLFQRAMTRFPEARRGDHELMRKYLDPRPGEHILGFGEGNGYFYRPIADAVGREGKYLVTDAGVEQLQGLQALPHVDVRVMAIEDLDAPEGSFHKIWSIGAFHHCNDQLRAMKRMYRALRPGGKLVTLDVFTGTPLARFFDAQVALYCETGHEVKFLSEEFARSLCILAGFAPQDVTIEDVPHRWLFARERDIGAFIYDLLCLSKAPGTSEEEKIQHVLEGCRQYLTIEGREGEFVLHFPQKALVAVK